MAQTYTYTPHKPEVYGGKMFAVTLDPQTDPPTPTFMVGVAVDESEIPALVEHHLNPPPQAPYPPPGPPIPTADQRLDAGIAAAYDVAVTVKDALAATPNNFTATNFAAAMVQLDALTSAFVEMLKAQMPAPPPP